MRLGLALACITLIPSSALALSVDDVLSRFEGQYQGVIDGGALGRPDEGPIVLHTFVHRIEAPAFGDAVMYLEQRYGGPDGTINRQRVFTFAQDNDDVLTTAYDFTEGAKYARSDAVPERLSELTPEDLYSFPEGCRIRWSDENGTFVGAVSRKDCGIKSRFGWGTVFVDMVYRVTDTAYTLFEEGYDDADKLLFGAPDAQVHKRLPNIDLDDEVQQILSAFEGTFDALPPASGTPPFEGMMRRFHTKVRTVDLPAFGSYVQYLEVTENGPDGDVLRQRINVFEDNPDRAANVMVSYAIRDGAGLVGAYTDPSKLAHLRPEDLDAFETGCELIWSKIGNVHTGTADRSTCHIFNENLSVWRHVSFMYMLDGHSMHVWEQGFTPDGDFIFGSRMPLQFPRTRTSW